MDREQALKALSALAHADRLDLIRLLVRQGPEGMAAGQIGQALGGLAASRLSFHLAALEGAALISSRKAARNVIYAARPEVLGGLLSYLLHDCCSADPRIFACCLGHGEAGTDKT